MILDQNSLHVFIAKYSRSTFLRERQTNAYMNHKLLREIAGRKNSGPRNTPTNKC